MLIMICFDLPGSLTMSSSVNHLVTVPAASFWMGKIISLDELYIVVIGNNELYMCVQAERGA